MAEEEKQDATTEQAEPVADVEPAAEADPAAESEPAAEPEATPETPAPAEEEPPPTEEEVVEEPAAPAAEAEAAPEEAAPDDAAPEEPAAAAEAATPAAPAPTKRKRVARPLRRRRVKPKREPSATRKPITRLPKPEHERGRRQERRGVVVSSAMDKTIVVKVDTLKVHPRYKKVIRRSAKFHAHDEGNKANVGDLVRIVETRPLSKTKSWRLVEVLEAAK
jgi:small subunit ribosomal protein S17